MDFQFVDVASFDVLTIALEDVENVHLILSHRAVVKLCSPVIYRDFIERYDGCSFLPMRVL